MQRILFLIVCSLALVAFVGCQKSPEPDSTVPSLKPVHLFNLPSDISEAELLSILDAFNQVFNELGHPDICYRLWKVQGEQIGNYTYLWESTWPDRATYNEVHEADVYRTVIEQYRKTLEAALKDQVYNQYTDLQ